MDKEARIRKRRRLGGFMAFIFGRKKIYHTPPDRDYDMNGRSLDLLEDAKEQDIVLYRMHPKSLTSGIISHFTSSPYSHAEIYQFDGYTISADGNGITFKDLYKATVYGAKPPIGPLVAQNVDIFRLKGGLTREQRLIIQAKALQSLAKPYDYSSLLNFPYLRGEKALKRSADDAYICSEHVAWCYKNAGIDIIKDRPEAIEAPADIGLSDVLEYVGTYVRGKRIKGSHRNKFYEQEYSFLQKLIGGAMKLFSKKDEFYKYVRANKKLMKGEIINPKEEV